MKDQNPHPAATTEEDLGVEVAVSDLPKNPREPFAPIPMTTTIYGREVYTNHDGSVSGLWHSYDWGACQAAQPNTIPASRIVRLTRIADCGGGVGPRHRLELRDYNN